MLFFLFFDQEKGGKHVSRFPIFSDNMVVIVLIITMMMIDCRAMPGWRGPWIKVRVFGTFEQTQLFKSIKMFNWTIVFDQRTFEQTFQINHDVQRWWGQYEDSVHKSNFRQHTFFNQPRSFHFFDQSESFSKQWTSLKFQVEVLPNSQSTNLQLAFFQTWNEYEMNMEKRKVENFSEMWKFHDRARAIHNISSLIYPLNICQPPICYVKIILR